MSRVLPSIVSSSTLGEFLKLLAINAKDRVILGVTLHNAEAVIVISPTFTPYHSCIEEEFTGHLKRFFFLWKWTVISNSTSCRECSDTFYRTPRLHVLLLLLIGQELVNHFLVAQMPMSRHDCQLYPQVSDSYVHKQSIIFGFCFGANFLIFFRYSCGPWLVQKQNHCKIPRRKPILITWWVTDVSKEHSGCLPMNGVDEHCFHGVHIEHRELFHFMQSLSSLA